MMFGIFKACVWSKLGAGGVSYAQTLLYCPQVWTWAALCLLSGDDLSPLPHHFCSTPPKMSPCVGVIFHAADSCKWSEGLYYCSPTIKADLYVRGTLKESRREFKISPHCSAFRKLQAYLRKCHCNSVICCIVAQAKLASSIQWKAVEGNYVRLFLMADRWITVGCGWIDTLAPLRSALFAEIATIVWTTSVIWISFEMTVLLD